MSRFDSPRLLVKRLTESAKLPARGSELAAGFDLSASEPAVVPPKGKALVPTGLAVATPPGTYARIAPRSGLALKKFIDVGAGVVDQDYRGPVGVVLFNFGDEPFEIKVGDRIAQMILEHVCYAPAEEVEELDDSARGAGGFGSTGVAGDAANKRARAVSPPLAGAGAADDAAGGGAIARALVFVARDLAAAEAAGGADAAAALRDGGVFADAAAASAMLKPLALRADERLLGAIEAFGATGNFADLCATLRLIVA